MCKQPTPVHWYAFIVKGCKSGDDMWIIRIRCKRWDRAMRQQLPYRSMRPPGTDAVTLPKAEKESDALICVLSHPKASSSGPKKRPGMCWLNPVATVAARKGVCRDYPPAQEKAKGNDAYGQNSTRRSLSMPQA